MAMPAWALPWGYQGTFVQGPAGGTAAVAYAPDGTAYLAEMGSSNLLVIAPGGARSILPVTGATLMSVGGMNFAPDGRLLITDNKNWGDGSGDLYALNVATGAAQTLLTGVDCIEDVVARPSGEIFISDAVGADRDGHGLGSIKQVFGDGTTANVVSGLVYPAGMAFDSQGRLVFQQADDNFAGQVYRMDVAGGAGGLSFGTPSLLADNLAASFDMAMDGEDDVFVSGSGGIYQLNRDGDGNFTGSASGFVSRNFSTEMAFHAGVNPFTGGVDSDGGHLLLVPEYGSSTLVDVTPVPEPLTAGLLVLGGLLGMRRRRR
jgi:hypothetical protein